MASLAVPVLRGWYKLNFDGSVHHDGSGRASIGCAIRDCACRFVAAFVEQTDHAPIDMVEACALVRGIHLDQESGFINRLLIKGDDLTLERLLRGEPRQTHIS
ncbi:uncharacterized protein C2845_PM12G04500 [Panicum miliaceum]|uniref:RNase H type-1 domain-containing protein n=1 Tax=Panicum miliaceum TaxID=4540 RepID=A0A3L6QJ82_PANMI|nr:uncharacterized protein C2845_PM12G04500 [Panicum miliaceum]